MFSKNGGGSYEYVDLGLASGTKWATCNIGAETETDYGAYFAWGDVSGYTADQVGSGTGKKYFGWADYVYGNGTSRPGATGMSKYNSTDKKVTLELTDDAARVNMGGAWRMPTNAEFVELRNSCRWTWTTINGINGHKVINKNDSSKYIFFPAAGLCYDGSVGGVGSSGFYWSSSLYESSVIYAWSLGIDSLDGSTSYYSRYNGRCVRGVIDNV